MHGCEWIGKFCIMLITSNDHLFYCPIICADIYSQCYFVHWHPNNAWHNQAHWPIRTPHLSTIASNVPKYFCSYSFANNIQLCTGWFSIKLKDQQQPEPVVGNILLLSIHYLFSLNFEYWPFSESEMRTDLTELSLNFKVKRFGPLMPPRSSPVNLRQIMRTEDKSSYRYDTMEYVSWRRMDRNIWWVASLLKHTKTLWCTSRMLQKIESYMNHWWSHLIIWNTELGVESHSVPYPVSLNIRQTYFPNCSPPAVTIHLIENWYIIFFHHQ